MDNENLREYFIEQLETEGFQLDEEGKCHTLIDFRGTHKVVTYWRDGMWITFTTTIEDDNGTSIPFDELLKEYKGD